MDLILKPQMTTQTTQTDFAFNDTEIITNKHFIKMKNISKLVLSGGGLLGISYIGLFKFLEEHNIHKQIKSIIGCSAGAIFGAFFTLGYTALELEHIIKSLNFKDYINITAESIINFMKLKGFESGKNIMKFIKTTIKDKTQDENITFKQIYEKYNIELKIGVTNLTTSTFDILDVNTNPHMPIYKAINASIAIPFVFEPVNINNCMYCDGGILDNLPIEHIINISTTEKINEDKTKQQQSQPQSQLQNKDKDIVKDKDTLGIYLLNKFTSLTCDNYQQLSLSHYFNALMHAFCKSYVTHKQEITKKIANTEIIIFEIPCDIMTFLKLSASHADIDNIINIAYTITKEQLITIN